MRELYIDFDGVLMDTITTSYRLLDEQQVDLDNYDEVLKFYQTLNWEQVIEITPILYDSMDRLKRMKESNRFNISVLTHVNSVPEIVEKVKELVRKGNVSKILVKKNDETIVNLPVNVGLLGIVFVPWVTLVSVIAALGTKCSIELVKDNGEVINLSSKAAETFDDVKSNYSVIADDLKEKGEECDLDTIAQDIKDRDERDMNRETAPLKKAEDAVLVDSSYMTIPEVVSEICSHCK